VAGDNDALVATNKAFATYDTDLLYQDATVKAWAIGGDTSALGAHVWIGTDGKIHYDATNIADQFDSLAAGETTTDTIKYTIKMSNGTLSVGTLTVVINGTNDAPVITSDAQAGTVKEDTKLTATGQVTSSDVDHGATAAYSGNATGTYGSFAIDAKTGAWTYTLDNAGHQDLAEGESHTETFKVTVTDDKGATSTQDVLITITGTNDAPVVAAALTAPAAEGDLSFTKDLLAGASDVDHGETATLQVTDVHYSVDGGAASLTAPAGLSLSGASLTVDPTNTAFDHLAVGEHTTIVVSYNVMDAQGATVAQTETITITGTNDAPVAPIDQGGPTGINFVLSQGQLLVADSTTNGNQLSGNLDLGAFVATGDPDQNDTFHYQLGGTDAALFSLNASSGELFTGTNGVNSQANPYALTITATDQANNQTSTNVSVWVAGSGNDTLNGGSGIDIMFGQNGSDSLTGNAGNDALLGGPKDDDLYGGAGADQLVGGAGKDNFIYKAISDSLNTAAGQDTIYNFNSSGSSQDTIDFLAISQITGYQGHLNDLSSTVAAHSVSWIESGGNTIVYANATGLAETQANADMKIILTGVNLGLSHDNFLLHV
jgi:VCBS repeat-containing protein